VAPKSSSELLGFERGLVKHVSYKDLKEVYTDLKAIYTAPTAEVGMLNLEAFADKWDKKYEYISRGWIENGECLSSFWSYPTEIRRLIYTTAACRRLQKTGPLSHPKTL
jgi:putative transposase